MIAERLRALDDKAAEKLFRTTKKGDGDALYFEKQPRTLLVRFGASKLGRRLAAADARFERRMERVGFVRAVIVFVLFFVIVGAVVGGADGRFWQAEFFAACTAIAALPMGVLRLRGRARSTGAAPGSWQSRAREK